MQQVVVTESGYVLNAGPDGRPLLPDVGTTIHRCPSVVADPFGGVCGFGLVGGWAGLQVILVELEQRFVDLGNANIELHAATWDAAHPRPVILHGDSRRLAEIIGAAGGLATSPPFQETLHGQDEEWLRKVDADRTARGLQYSAVRHHSPIYGSTPGNLGNMPPGSVAGLATSPPFGKQQHHGGDTPCARGEGRNTRSQRPIEAAGGHNLTRTYGDSEGNLDALPMGTLDGAVSSPPYAESLQDAGGARTPNAPPGFKLGRSTAGVVSSPPYGDETTVHMSLTASEAGRVRAKEGTCASDKHSYGSTPGNLGNMPPGSVAGLATSPPYAEIAPGQGGLNTLPPRRRWVKQCECGYHEEHDRLPVPHDDHCPKCGCFGSCVWSELPSDDQAGRSKGPSQPDHATYGGTPGQLGGMPPGSLDGLSTSPPYANALTRGDSVPDTPNSARMREMGGRMAYGVAEGQLGEMEAGSLDGLASSPPFLYSHGGHDSDLPVGHKGAKYSDESPVDSTTGGDRTSDEAAAARKERAEATRNLAQIVVIGNKGNLVNTDTFWAAARDIVAQCALVLKPGAVTAWVCKDFVRAKKRVPFCNDWCRLLEMCGFTVFERWRMWQRSAHSQHDIFGNKAPCKESKGFFRRLAESKGSPRIDFEETIWAERRLHGSDDRGELFEQAPTGAEGSEG